MKKLLAAIQFTKNYKSVGAFKESSAGVEREICSKLTNERPLQVVEFGTGLGNITRAILKELHPESTLTSFEINKEFCEQVREAIKDDRLTIINDSAERVKEYVDAPVDYIIGSLPYSFLPKAVGMNIIESSFDILKDDGYYSQYLYVTYFARRFKHVFPYSEKKLIKNIPIEYVYHFGKVK